MLRLWLQTHSTSQGSTTTPHQIRCVTKYIGPGAWVRIVTTLLWQNLSLVMPGTVHAQARLAHLLLYAHSKARRLWKRVTRTLHLSSHPGHSLSRLVLRATSSTSKTVQAQSKTVCPVLRTQSPPKGACGDCGPTVSAPSRCRENSLEWLLNTRESWNFDFAADAPKLHTVAEPPSQSGDATLAWSSPRA